jgi:hypothetical protein
VHDERFAWRPEQRELLRRFDTMQRTAQQAVDELLRDGVAVPRVAKSLGRTASHDLVAGGIDDDHAHPGRGERAREPIALHERGFGFPLRSVERALETNAFPFASQPNRPVM